MQHQTIRGRGSADNPPNRFEKFHYDDSDVEIDEWEDERPAPTTQFFREQAKSIISTNDSPDVGFDTSINAYRGCEHGCIYCYARPFHEYLGFSSGIDFETKIIVKENAPELLRKELSSPRWQPRVVAMSGVTDCYQPIERKLQLTRRLMEIFAEFRNPVGIVTKNHLVTRDIDLLQRLAEHQAVAVFVSVTSLNAELARRMEPRTSQPARRLAAIEKLSKAGIPVGALMCPVVPGLTDHEVPAVIAAVANAGAQYAGYNILRLPFAVKDLFEAWLERHFPEKKQKVLSKVRAVRNGKMYESEFGTRMSGEGVFAEQVCALFTLACKKAGIWDRHPTLSIAAFRRPVQNQMELFQ